VVRSLRPAAPTAMSHKRSDSLRHGQPLGIARRIGPPGVIGSTGSRLPGARAPIESLNGQIGDNNPHDDQGSRAQPRMHREERGEYDRGQGQCQHGDDRCAQAHRHRGRQVESGQLGRHQATGRAEGTSPGKVGPPRKVRETP
jgi:hypothetical protein